MAVAFVVSPQLSGSSAPAADGSKAARAGTKKMLPLEFPLVGAPASAFAVGLLGGAWLSSRRQRERALCHRSYKLLCKALATDAPPSIAEAVVAYEKKSDRKEGAAADDKSPVPKGDEDPSVWSAIVLVAGTTIGAGVLALPAVTQPAGFVPSTVSLLGCWVYMVVTGLLIAEVAVDTMAKTGRSVVATQSMAEQTIGGVGASLSSLLFAFVHVAIMTAYVSRGGELLENIVPDLMSSPVPPVVIYAGLCGGLVFATKNTKALDVANSIMLAAIVAAFFVLIALLLPISVPSRLTDVSDWVKVTDTIPTLLLSLVYHNVVPNICAQLQCNRDKIWTAIIAGSLIPTGLFVLWNAAFLAATTPGSLMGSTDPLEALRASGGPVVSTIFFQAIDKAGAFGVSLLFGFVPAWMAYASREANDKAFTKNGEPFAAALMRQEYVPYGNALLALVALGALYVGVLSYRLPVNSKLLEAHTSSS
eukprot:TRINITY_DN58851_c2_g1_i1.p1 TRINITY_DN58851_c2_g1~~TRINITY_DN58851_c2_g1_i1.p1  ORF type:complete len:477 (+),score=82.51 TRINITY_DN58851_c2_g1_i1:38-1468(+)